MKKAAIISALGVFALFFVGVFSINIGDEGIAGETQDGCPVGAITTECPNEIQQITTKAPLANDDVLLLEDSASTPAWQKKSIKHEDLLELPHCGLIAENENINIPLAVTSTYYLYDKWEVVAVSNDRCTADLTNDRLTLTEAGTYLITANVTHMGTAATDFQWEIHKNAGRTICSVRQTSTNTLDMEGIAITCIVTGSVGTYFDLRVRCTTVGCGGITNARGRDAVMTMVKISPKL